MIAGASVAALPIAGIRLPTRVGAIVWRVPADDRTMREAPPR